MANDELLNYVRECLGRGLTREVIEGELLKVGWDRASVNDALNFVSGSRPVASMSENLAVGSYGKESKAETITPFKDVTFGESTALSGLSIKTGEEEAAAAKGIVVFPYSGKTRLRSKVFISLAAFIVLVFAGAAFWFYYAWLPARAFEGMPKAMVSLNSFDYSIRAGLKLFAVKQSVSLNDRQKDADAIRNLQPASMLGTFIGLFDKKSGTAASELLRGQIKIAQSADMSFVLPPELLNSEVELRSSGTYEKSNSRVNFSTLFDVNLKQEDSSMGLAAEFRSIEDIYYFRLVELPLALLGPAASLTPLGSLDPTKYLKNWYSVKLSTLAELKVLPTSTESAVSRNYADRLKKLVENSDLFTVKSISRNEFLNGSSAYKYTLALRENNIKTFFGEAIKTREDRALTKEEERGINDFAAQLKNAAVEMWIDKSNGHLMRLYISASNYKIYNLGANLELTFDFSDFNTAKVNKPDAISFDEQLKQIIESAFAQGGDLARAKNYYYVEKNYAAARSLAETVILTSKDNQEKAEAHWVAGMAGAMLGDNKTAEDHYNKSIELSPKYANPYSSLSVLYRIRGKYKQAEDFAKKAIAIDSNYSSAHENLGLAYVVGGKFKEAVSELKIAISLNPNEPLFHYALGNAYVEWDSRDKGNQNLAIVEYGRAIDLDPKFEDAYLNLVIIYSRSQRNFDEAFKIVDKGISNVPTSPKLRHSRAEIYDAAGQFDKYEQELVAIVGSYPFYQPAQIALFNSYAFDMKFEYLKKALYQYSLVTGRTKQQITSEINDAEGLLAANKKIILDAIAATAFPR